MIDLAGRRFGFLLVLAECGRDKKRGGVLWKCRCDCGQVHIAKSHHLRQGRVRSCGCKHNELVGLAQTTHGHTRGRKVSAEYAIWSSMLARCENPKSVSFVRYGARGITVCKRWHKFENFFADMGPRPSAQHSLERRRNGKGYSASNCVWVTRIVQANNCRTNRRLTFQCKTRTLANWSREVGVGVSTIWLRLKLGWTVAEALTIPVDRKRTCRPRRAA